MLLISNPFVLLNDVLFRNMDEAFMKDRFMKYIEEEKFDTDGLVEDVIDHKNGSNILNMARGFRELIVDFVEDFQSMTIFFVTKYLLSLHTVILFIIQINQRLDLQLGIPFSIGDITEMEGKGLRYQVMRIILEDIQSRI